MKNHLLRLLIAICLAMCFAGGLRAGWFEDSFAEHQAGNYQKKFEIVRKAADQGDASAQYNLGVMYVNGEGVTQDYKQAAKWYRKAAECSGIVNLAT